MLIEDFKVIKYFSKEDEEKLDRKISQELESFDKLEEDICDVFAEIRKSYKDSLEQKKELILFSKLDESQKQKGYKQYKRIESKYQANLEMIYSYILNFNLNFLEFEMKILRNLNLVKNAKKKGILVSFEKIE